MSKDLVMQMLQSKPIAYRSDFAKITDSVTAGVMLSQLFYWDGKSTKHGDGWVEKNQKDFYDETGLSDKQQRTAKHILEKLGFIEAGRKGDRGKLCYRVNFRVVYKALIKFYSDRQKGSSEQIGKKAELDRQKGSSKIGKKAVLPLQRIHTENTTKNTASHEKPYPPSLITEIKTIFEKGYLNLTGKKLSWAGNKAAQYQKAVVEIALMAVDVNAEAPLMEVRERAKLLHRKILEEVRKGKHFYADQGFTPHTLYVNWNKMTAIQKSSFQPNTSQKAPEEIPETCKQFMPYLVFKYASDDIAYYEATVALSASFVEETFAKAGIKMKILGVKSVVAVEAQ